MSSENNLKFFSSPQIATVNSAVTIAEELVSDHYKMSTSEWLRPKYDIKTLADLTPEEVVEGPFAQIIRYIGFRKETLLGSNSYDFYKICLQDHTILRALRTNPMLKLFPFCLYIISHELIHIVRFSKFLQNYDASPEEKLKEETRVHEGTHRILHHLNISGLNSVLQFYSKWREPIIGFNDY